MVLAEWPESGFDAELVATVLWVAGSAMSYVRESLSSGLGPKLRCGSACLSMGRVLRIPQPIASDRFEPAPSRPGGLPDKGKPSVFHLAELGLVGIFDGQLYGNDRGSATRKDHRS